MKNSGFKRKPPDPQKQIKEAHRDHKREMRKLMESNSPLAQAMQEVECASKGKSRSNAKGRWYKGVYFKSTWQLSCWNELEEKQSRGLIRDLKHEEIVTYIIKREDGAEHKEQIEVDYSYFDIGLNRAVRADAKPLRYRIYWRNGKRVKYDADKGREDWFRRWEQLKFLQPDFMYVIWRQHSTWRGIDI